MMKMRETILHGLPILAYLFGIVAGRPMVRHIRSAHEFDRLLQKHATETGLPVIADFYSDGCGPCRMIAPVYQQLAKQTGQENAVFVKIDVNGVHELSARYGVRSMPTFLFFHNGKKVNEFSGAGEQQLRQFTTDVVNRSKRENVLLTLDSLVEYYGEVDGTKALENIKPVYEKCADMNKKYNEGRFCIGSAASQLSRRLKQKYGTAPKTSVRFTESDRSPDSGKTDSTDNKQNKSNTKPSSSSSDMNKPNLNLATKEELMAELEKRLDEEEDAKYEEEVDDDAEFEHGWIPGDFPERVTIIGGGPAGMSAAIYAARAGLTPVVVAPPMGGQLQGKGVDVENYPGLLNVTGPAVVASMRAQAAQYGAVFEGEAVTHIDVSTQPYRVHTNSSTIHTHAIIVATGAESNWLNIPGEYEMRGGGVSSCATCDGAAFYNTDVLVVGGGDAAMEDALVLARTSKSVTIIHRRDTFRASKVLAQRVMEHPSITILWNTVVQEILGTVKEDTDTNDDSESMDLDSAQKIVTSALVKNVETNEISKLECSAVFVAIGHTPTTSFLENIVEFDPDHPGYIKTMGSSTKTSQPGIFAAGDVTDAIYRQAITSAGSGAAAALDAERWLSEEGLGNEAEEFEAELLAELMADEESPGHASSSDSYNAYEDAGGKVTGVKEDLRAEL